MIQELRLIQFLNHRSCLNKKKFIQTFRILSSLTTIHEEKIDRSITFHVKSIGDPLSPYEWLAYSLSKYNITPESHIKVLRIKEMITN